MLNKAVVDDIVKTIKRGRVALDEMLETFLPLTARKAGHTREMSMARTSLQQGRNWLGETLGALGQDYPYPDSIKPQNEKIEAPTDKAAAPSSASRLEEEDEQSAITLIKRRRLELSDFRQSLYALYEQLPADQRCLGPQRTLELAIIHFKEAGHALGHQLNREYEEQQEAEKKRQKAEEREAADNVDANPDSEWKTPLPPGSDPASVASPSPSDSNPDSTSPPADLTPEPSNPSAEQSARQSAPATDMTTTAADSPTDGLTQSSPTSAEESQPESSENTSSEPTPSESTDQSEPSSSSEELTESSTPSDTAPAIDAHLNEIGHLTTGEPLPPVSGTDDAGVQHPLPSSKKHKNKR